MKRTFSVLASLALCALLGACSSTPSGASSDASRQITQAGWFDSFAAGSFKGFVPVSTLADGADVGLGTYEGVDGELIILDGVPYNVSSDGLVKRMPGDATVPFAMSAKTSPADKTVVLTPGSGVVALTKEIDAAEGNPDVFIAVKAHVRFSKLKLRAPPKASEPYPALGDVIAKQKIFELQNVSGWLIGFRSPAAYAGMEVPGYHFHFISDDFSAGGHVLDMTVSGGEARIHSCNSIRLLLPDTFKESKSQAKGGAIPGESAGH